MRLPQAPVNSCKALEIAKSRATTHLSIGSPWPAHHTARRIGCPPALRTALLAALMLALLAALAGRVAAEAPIPATAEQDGALLVLAAGDLRGEIKPCGCSPEGQMGGLPRRLSYLERQLGAHAPRPILVDVGNNFPLPSAQGRLKIDLIQKLLGRYAPEALLPGPNELAMGVGTLDRNLPYLISNDGLATIFRRYRTVRRGQRRIGLYGYLSPATVYQGSQSHFRLQPADAELIAALRETLARERHTAAVLLFRGSDEELARFVRAGLFDLIVAGNTSADEMNQVTERIVAGVRIPQVPTKGQGVLRMKLPAPGQALMARAQVDWLKDEWPDHPDAAPVFQAYDEQVKELFFARLETMKHQQRQSPFAGAVPCKTCHTAAARVWAGSRHAHALATLERVGKQYDPECLACHVVGLERGGFLSQDLTPRLANVQCENCHGPAKTHAGNPGVKPGPVPSADGQPLRRPAEPTCRTCHVGSHSPRFSYPVYWPKVRHGS